MPTSLSCPTQFSLSDADSRFILFNVFPSSFPPKTDCNEIMQVKPHRRVVAVSA